MTKQSFVQKSHIDATPQEVFNWHERDGAFKRLTPAWEDVEIVKHVGGIKDGAQVELKLGVLGPIKQRWHLKHSDYIYGQQFRDVQQKGMFADYAHTHSMFPKTENGSLLEDRIDYELPLGVLGQLFGGHFAKSKFQRLFNYRHAVTTNDIHLHNQYKEQNRMKIAITGASGMIGSELSAFLSTGGHNVMSIVRSKPTGENEIFWQPSDETLQVSDLPGVDALVHLAGESIASGRWTEERKRRILESRVKGTSLLAKRLAAMKNPPKVVISASAIGYYGKCGAEIVSEDSAPGDDFLADVVQAWEDAWQPAVDAGIRVVKLRFGIVLSLAGGVLAKMHLPFQMGAGGIIGNGQQYMSWVALDDLLGIINHALFNAEMEGVYNAVAPQPVTNKKFTKTMGKVMHRPTFAPLPTPAVKLMFGEMGELLLLGGQNVSAQKLVDTGYEFLYPRLEPALQHALGK